jgi:cold-inducible RNA-binding protein
MKLYVGNMPFSMDESQVRALFETHGTVDSVSIITDRDTGRPRGFGFVEMADDEACRAAMAALDNYMVDGRNLKVNEAKPRESGGRGGRGGGRGGRY